MPSYKTAKRCAALMCCGGVLFAAGCGGGSSHATGTSTSASTAASTSASAGVNVAAEHSQACATALQTLGVYRAATIRAGLRFQKKSLMDAVISSAGQLRQHAQQLAKVSTPTEASQLEALGRALGAQQIVIAALVRKDEKTVKEHARGLEEGLSSGLANLRKICTGL